MPLPEQYLATTKNLALFFDALTNAQAPKKFTVKFLEQLEFKSINDRLFIGILKALKFINQEGVPQELYFQYIDQTQSKKVLAEAIKDAYSDLFSVNLKANQLSINDVKNKLKTLFQGSKTDNVLSLMANTFHALCNYADFTSNNKILAPPVETNDTSYETEELKDNYDNSEHLHSLVNKTITTEMHYNIQIHLPETRDISVYDAIFKSLKQHLL